MPRDAPISWRPPKDLRARLEALAGERGGKLSEVIEDLVRAGLDIRVGEPPASKVKRARDTAVARAGRARTGLCRHRRTPEQFCSRCDA